MKPIIGAALTTIWMFFLAFPGLYGKVIPVNDRNVRAGLSSYNWICTSGFIS